MWSNLLSMVPSAFFSVSVKSLLLIFLYIAYLPASNKVLLTLTSPSDVYVGIVLPLGLVN